MNNKGEGNTIGIFILFIVATLVIIVYFNPNILGNDNDEPVDIVYDSEITNEKFNWFKSQYEEIQSVEIQIDNIQDRLEDFKGRYETDLSAKEHLQRFEMMFQSQVIEYENLVDEYNKRSALEDKSLFQERLPKTITKRWSS